MCDDAGQVDVLREVLLETLHVDVDAVGHLLADGLVDLQTVLLLLGLQLVVPHALLVRNCVRRRKLLQQQVQVLEQDLDLTFQRQLQLVLRQLGQQRKDPLLG